MSKASDIINKPTPKYDDSLAVQRGLTIYVPSAIISLNQKDIDNTKEIRLKSKLYSAYSNPWNDKTADVVRDSKLIDVYKVKKKEILDERDVLESCFYLSLTYYLFFFFSKFIF
jgi:hypothetical protein